MHTVLVIAIAYLIICVAAAGIAYELHLREKGHDR